MSAKNIWKLSGIEPFINNDAGHYPYTSGIHPEMYRSKPWTIRQYGGFGSAEETNQRYKYLLAKGVAGLSVAFDLPTQMGRDSDNEMAQGEVGRVGVAISSLEDMETLFAGINIEEISTSMTINSTAHILLGFYLVMAEKQGIAWNKLRGTVQNDVLKEFIARGTYIYPPVHALRITSDLIEYCTQHVPQWNTISISGYHIREAGSTAIEEVGLTLADGICYVQSMLDRGIAVDDFAPRLAFFFNAHNNFFEEIAKFRAARKLWANLMRERFGAKNARSLMLRFHTQTAGSSLSAQEPQVNILRTAYQALSAVLGGTQSLHTNGYDEAISLPSEEAAKIAIQTQKLILKETGITELIDPLAGSYVIEDLTNKIELGAQAIINKIDELGGMVRAIELNYPQSLIEKSAYDFQKSLERGDIEIVGREGVVSEPKFRIDKDGEHRQCEKLLNYKNNRNQNEVIIALTGLKQKAIDGGNLMPEVVQAIRCKATLGEISNELQTVFSN